MNEEVLQFYVEKVKNKVFRVTYKVLLFCSHRFAGILHRYFPPTDDLQDLVRYDIKLVLIV